MSLLLMVNHKKKVNRLDKPTPTLKNDVPKSQLIHSNIWYYNFYTYKCIPLHSIYLDVDFI